MQPFSLRLLLAAVDGDGTITWMDNGGETALATGGDDIAAGHNARIMAEHRAALQELLSNGFIKQRTNHHYDVEAAGFKHADEFRSRRNDYGLGILEMTVLCKAFHRGEGYRNIERHGEPRSQNPKRVTLKVGPEKVSEDAQAIDKCIDELKRPLLIMQADDGGDVWHLDENGIKQAKRLCGLAD